MGTGIWSKVRETYPPKPTFTEKDLPDLSGSVYLITGGTGGIGFELAKFLYEKNGTVFMAGRNAENGDKAISTLKSLYPESNGHAEFLNIDLSDLTRVKPAVEELEKRTQRLDVVWHNAGVMMPPFGSKTKQGYEIQLGTNILAPWLLQHFLTPLQARTAALSDTPKASVRSVWTGSFGIHLSPPNGGIKWDDMNFQNCPNTSMGKMNAVADAYAQSKAANLYLSKEAAKRWGDKGIISLCLNPGNLKTDLQRHAPGLLNIFLEWFMLYPAYYGGLTELFAGLSPKIDEGKNGAYVIPWGRFGDEGVRKDIQKGVEEGNGKRLWEWCENECKPYM